MPTKSLGLHFGATDTDDLQPGDFPPQRGDEMSSEKIPRSLPRDHAYDDGIAFHRG